MTVENTFSLKLIIAISISLYVSLLMFPPLVFGQIHFGNDTIIDSDNEEKRLNPPLPPIQIKFSTPPVLPSKEIDEFENSIKEINDPPSIPITNKTILGPNNTMPFDKATNTTEFQTSLKPKKPSLIVTKNITFEVIPTSHVVETSIANKNNTIFYTGNTFAARSGDGGKTWSSINANYFPNLHGDYKFHLHGDQDVIYDPTHDIFLWYMQGVPTIMKKNGVTVGIQNEIRLGVSSDAYEWTFYTFVPQDIHKDLENHRADYPSLSLSKKYLYITTNVETPNPYRQYPIIIRILLDDLAKRVAPAFDYYSDPSINATTFTPVQGVSYKMDKMYWGILLGNDKIKIYEWLDSSPHSTIKSYERYIHPWTPLNKKNDAEKGECRGLDLYNWCSRGASKIRTGFIANDVLGFFWDANKGGEGSYSLNNAPFQYPYINAATFKITDNMTYIGRPYLWSPTFAWMYPSTAVDSNGNVIIQAFFGGGKQFYPSLAVGVGNDFTGSSQPWNMMRLVNGTDGPSPSSWGDYLKVRQYNGKGPGWIGSGWTLNGGYSKDYIHPYYFEFNLGNNNSGSQK